MSSFSFPEKLTAAGTDGQKERKGDTMSEKKVILASHGELSRGMMHSVQMIVGQNEDLSCMGMMPGEHYQPMVDKVKEMAEQNPQTQYIVITDLFGGSVCNGMTMLAGYPNVKVLAGMNMGLVINVLLTPGTLTEEQLEEIIGESREALLEVQPVQPDEGEDEFF